MDKKVFVISRNGCQLCERLEYELKYIHNISFSSFTNTKTPEIFGDFQRHFLIDRFPVVQVDDGKDLITIHWDSNFSEQQSGPGGKQPLLYTKVDNVDELIAKAVEIYKR